MNENLPESNEPRDERACPMCGEPVKVLPNHLRNHCEVTQS